MMTNYIEDIHRGEFSHYLESYYDVIISTVDNLTLVERDGKTFTEGAASKIYCYPNNQYVRFNEYFSLPLGGNAEDVIVTKMSDEDCLTWNFDHLEIFDNNDTTRWDLTWSDIDDIIYYEVDSR